MCIHTYTFTNTCKVAASMHVCAQATHKYTNAMFVLVSLSGGWLEKPDRCNPVSLSTSETWPMGCQRPLCRIMGPKCTVWCRGRAWTDSRKWWHESGLSITFKMRWGTSGRWVQADTTSSRACRPARRLYSAVWVDLSEFRYEILWRRWESECMGSLEECSNQCGSFQRKWG